MYSVLTILLILTLSMAIVRIATVALSLTGLSDQLARFQARSAFFGVGFTTKESENVVNHPVRRRIIMLLMLFGQVGIITTAATLIGSIVHTDTDQGWFSSYWSRIVALLFGVSMLWWLSHSSYVDRALSVAITWALKRWTSIEVRDYTWLLRLSHKYAISELQVEPDDWLAGRTLTDLQLTKEGVLVLGIERESGVFIGVPRGDTRLNAGDSVILYGRDETLAELDERGSGMHGNLRHVIAVSKELEVEEEEQNRDSQR